MRNYNISVEGKEFSYVHSNFIAKYGTYLARLGINSQIYSMNNMVVILDFIDEKEINRNKEITNNLTLIGTKRLINKTINEIKSKGFKLEEIINN